MTGIRILLVDDEPEVRAVFCEYLRGIGHSVLAAASGREAIRVLDETEDPFDVALVDWQMVGISGRDVVGYIADHSPRTKIFVCTGLTDLQFTQKHSEVPLAGVIRKPVRLREMAREITRHVRREESG